MSPPGPLSPRSVVSDVPKSPTGHAARKKPFDHLAPPLPPPPSLRRRRPCRAPRPPRASASCARAATRPRARASASACTAGRGRRTTACTPSTLGMRGPRAPRSVVAIVALSRARSLPLLSARRPRRRSPRALPPSPPPPRRAGERARAILDRATRPARSTARRYAGLRYSLRATEAAHESAVDLLHTLLGGKSREQIAARQVPQAHGGAPERQGQVPQAAVREERGHAGRLVPGARARAAPRRRRRRRRPPGRPRPAGQAHSRPGRRLPACPEFFPSL